MIVAMQERATEEDIQGVIERLKPSLRDGKPTLYILRNALVERDEDHRRRHRQ